MTQHPKLGLITKRGAPILGRKIKDVANATADTIQGTINHSGDYVGSRLREGRDILTGDTADAEQMRRDEANDVAYLHNLADVLTPGTFKDLTRSVGYYAGGDKKAALHTIAGIGLNYKKELRENPAEFALNTASVVLPTAGICFKAAADMDRLAAAYDALGDVKMAERARGWENIYRKEAALGKGPKNMFGRRPGPIRPAGSTGAPSSGRPVPVGPQPRPGGVLLRREGDYWVKSVDPTKHPLIRAYAGKTIRSMAAALDKLGDMGAPHYLNGNELWVKDVGKYPYPAYSPEYLKRYWQGTLRLGTPLNDIKPRNMGVNGEIFDPVLQPGGQSVLIGSAGAVGYLLKDGYDAYHGK